MSAKVVRTPNLFEACSSVGISRVPAANANGVRVDRLNQFLHLLGHPTFDGNSELDTTRIDACNSLTLHSAGSDHGHNFFCCQSVDHLVNTFILSTTRRTVMTKLPSSPAQCAPPLSFFLQMLGVSSISCRHPGLSIAPQVCLCRNHTPGHRD
jgi:hypothetical protein